MDTQLSPFFQQSNPGPSPVAPGFIQASTDAGRSIENGVQNLGSDLVDAVKQHKQNVQDQSDVDTAFPMLVKQMGANGIAPDTSVLNKFGSASLSAKKGMIGALATQYATQMKAKTDVANNAEAVARAGYYGDVGNARVQAESDANDQAGALSRWAQKMAANPEVMKGMTPAAAANFKAMADVGATSPRAAAPFLKMFSDQMNADGTGAVPKFITLGDDKIPVIYGKGGQFQIDPAYAENLKATNAKNMLDYKTQIGQQLQSGGAKPFSANGKVVPNVFVMPNGKPLDLRSEMEKQMGGAALPAADGTGQPGATPTTGGGGAVTPAMAQQLLQQAGGDKVKARALATQAGLTF